MKFVGKLNGILSIIHKSRQPQLSIGKCSFIQNILPCLSLPNVNVHTQIHTQALNKNLILKSNNEIDKPKNSGSKNPVVMLLSWLMSKEKHLEKYEKVYLSQGFDVLMVRLTPLQLMFPKNGSHVVADQAAKWLANHEEYTDIIFHAFSVGGYLFGEILNTIRNNQYLGDSIRERVRGQIFDSIVAMEGIPTAFPRAVANNPMLVKLLEIYVKSHLSLLKNTATTHYINSFDVFCNHSMKVPSLFLMSKADTLGYHGEMMKVANLWKQKGMQVYTKCWDNSPHCSHYLHYPKEYVNEVAQLLENIDLLQDRDKLAALV